MGWRTDLTLAWQLPALTGIGVRAGTCLGTLPGLLHKNILCSPRLFIFVILISLSCLLMTVSVGGRSQLQWEAHSQILVHKDFAWVGWRGEHIYPAKGFVDDTLYGDAGRREGKLSRLLLCVLEVFALSFSLIWNKSFQTVPPAFPSFLSHQLIPRVPDAACLCSLCQ